MKLTSVQEAERTLRVLRAQFNSICGDIETAIEDGIYPRVLNTESYIPLDIATLLLEIDELGDSEIKPPEPPEPPDPPDEINPPLPAGRSLGDLIL